MYTIERPIAGILHCSETVLFELYRHPAVLYGKSDVTHDIFTAPLSLTRRKIENLHDVFHAHLFLT
jgi:hypothetical protein